MAHIGSATFTNWNDYQSCIRLVGMTVDLVFPSDVDFKARLTWLKQRHLYLLNGRESVPRIACLSFVPTRAFVSFPTGSTKGFVCGGNELRVGDVMFHSRGERTFQRTKGESKWGIISVPYSQLTAYAMAVIGHDITAPTVSCILRPLPSFGAQLRDFHVRACRVAETKPEILAHPEVVRAMEDELLHALVNCLIANDNSLIRRDQTDVVLRFEDALVEYLDQRPSISELCAAINVTEWTLRACCTEVLGVSPSRYMYLRRMHRTPAATVAS